MRRCLPMPWVLAVLAWAVMAAHAQPPATSPGSSSGEGEKLLEDFDHAERMLRESVWALYEGTAAMGADARGKTISDDLDAWVMTDGARAQLKSARIQAQRLLQAGDEAGARAALRIGQADIEEQRRRVTLISVYRWRQLSLDRQRELWTRWLKDAPADVAASSRARIKTLESALSSSYSPDITVSELQSELDGLNRAYNEERSRLAQVVSEQRVAAGQVLASRDRTLPCPAPPQGTQPTADTALPRPATDVAVDEYYPASDSHAGISGRVILRLTITPQGCMKHAEVHRSSGAPGLDDAAMDVAERMSFFPARKNGQPVEGSFLMAFTFEMQGQPISPGWTPNPLIRAVALLSHGDYGGAIAALDAILKSNPTNTDALANRGIAHLWNHQVDLARADLQQALVHDPRNFVALRGQAILALRTRQFAQAVTGFTAALAIVPNDLYSLQERAEAALEAGQIDQALAYNAQTLQAWPSRPNLYITRAFMLRAQHKPQEALAQASALLRALPSDAGASWGAGFIYAAGGQEAQALSAFDQAVRLSPGESAYLQRAALRPQSDRAGRQADIDAALHLNPGSAPAAVALVALQLDAGDYAKAIQTATRALQLHADNELLLIRRGIAYLKTQQLAAGESDLTQARAHAKTPSALNTLCWELATANVALDRALSACDAALAMEPLTASYLDSRAFTLLRLGRYGQALQYYNEALKSSPFEVASLYGRALVYQRLHNTAAAQAGFQAALALDARIADQFAGYGFKPAG